MTGCEGLTAGTALACNEKIHRLDRHRSSGYILGLLYTTVIDVKPQTLRGSELHSHP